MAKTTKEDALIHWIDFEKLGNNYTKQLPQVLDPKEFAEEFKFYLSCNKKYNIYGLAAHLLMGKDRFTKLYLNSSDPLVKEMAHTAISIMTNHALNNEEDYKRSLRYIMSQAETGKAFIELSTEVLDASKDKVIILPSKDK